MAKDNGSDGEKVQQVTPKKKIFGWLSRKKNKTDSPHKGVFGTSIDPSLKKRISEKAARHRSESHANLIRDIKAGKIAPHLLKKINVPGRAKEAKKPKKDFKKIWREKRLEMRVRRKYALKRMVQKSGLSSSSEKVPGTIRNIAIGITAVATFLLLGHIITKFGFNPIQLIMLFFIIWTLGFPIVFFATWLGFYGTLDIMIFKRKIEIEDVLADFLELASTNIRAGLPIDKALWFAVRPRFGVLAKEIEDVAKHTLTGEDLEVALQDFVNKYDSKILVRSISLLIEGLRAGSEIGDLLNRIASNIHEVKLMKKEMAANVTTYVIFISFATVAGAPFLFGLSYNLIDIIQQITSAMDLPSGGPISVSGSAVKLSDFRLFSILSLAITSFWASMIVGTIKTGNIKQSLRYIPFFICTTIPIYFAVSFLFGIVLSGFFQ